MVFCIKRENRETILHVKLSTKKGWFFVMLDRIALILAIVGGLNWGSIGLFQFDIVAWLFGGQDALLSRIIYTVIALAAVWCVSLLFRERDTDEITGEVR
jgi:uncharacterized membrane protein YuzA (DUF378 family)